jgi:hypothetical protein
MAYMWFWRLETVHNSNIIWRRTIDRKVSKALDREARTDFLGIELIGRVALITRADELASGVGICVTIFAATTAVGFYMLPSRPEPVTEGTRAHKCSSMSH